ncbi:amidohydrolase family protein [Streptomyces sp. GC420]|uniref:amidohydrolase family protein n=1 Tax=Streptomyces sp. GC420 TaxID=2697568 RepID=UPI001414CED6|nr:amidohydrolase family protein [Streptomyces sp. GC420]NBM15661.1 amidohydrolase family protein [Streptomyces sp. GC420]
MDRITDRLFTGHGDQGPGRLDFPPLVDHHCHGVTRAELGLGSFEPLLSESASAPASGTTFFDTQAGFAVRRWCPPVLGLEPHASPAAYLARRRELGGYETARRLLSAAGIGTFLVDTGLPGDLTGPGETATAAGGTAREIVRLEHLAEQVADTSGSAGSFVGNLAEAVHAATRSAAGFKSVAAYRHGLALDPEPPAPGAVLRAAGQWLAARGTGDRLTDPVLLRHLLWSAVATGLPLQLHTGFGDPDLRLDHADPVLLTDFVRATEGHGCDLVLLHGYPYHRQAGYLAAVFPHVYADTGLALTHTGARAEAVLGEMLELTPFGKLLFSTDAHALPELYVVGAQLFRSALESLLCGWVEEGAWSLPDARRVTGMIAAGNARRVYRLPDA